MISVDQLPALKKIFDELKSREARDMTSYAPTVEMDQLRREHAAMIQAFDQAFIKLSNQIKDSMNDTRN